MTQTEIQKLARSMVRPVDAGYGGYSVRLYPSADPIGTYKTKAAALKVALRMAKNRPTKNPTIDARKVLKSGQSMLAKVRRVGNKLVMEPVKRVARRAVRRVRRAANPGGTREYSYTYNGHVYRVKAAKSAVDAKKELAKYLGIAPTALKPTKGKR